MEAMKREISKQIQTSPAVDILLDVKFHNCLQVKSLSDKLTLSVWLRQAALDSIPTDFEAHRTDELGHTADFALAYRLFLVARDVLESLEDYAILADVIGICLPSGSMEVMASLVDTLHFHHRCFAAIGALQPLLKQLIERYQSIRYHSSPERTYLQALADLCTTVGFDESIQQQLNHDISRCDQRNALAMCSPASDNAVDVPMSGALDSDEEVERILSSGTTMDEQSITRMFKRLVVRLEEQTSTLPPKPSRCGQWFAKLRNFDDSTFDGLIREWLSSSTFTSNLACYQQVLPPLIGSECLTLSIFAQIVDDCEQMLGADDYVAKLNLSLGMLDATLPAPSHRSAATIVVSDHTYRCEGQILIRWQEMYKCQLEKRKFAFQSPNIILHHMQRLISLASSTSDSSYQVAVKEMVSGPAALTFLRYMAIHSNQSLFESFKTPSAKMSSGASAVLKNMLDRLLDPADRLSE